MYWRLNHQLQQWEVTSGAWQAIVAQLQPGAWYPYVRRSEPPHDHYEGPTCEGALEGRVWCQTKLKELAAEQPAPGETR